MKNKKEDKKNTVTLKWRAIDAHRQYSPIHEVKCSLTELAEIRDEDWSVEKNIRITLEEVADIQKNMKYEYSFEILNKEEVLNEVINYLKSLTVFHT